MKINFFSALIFFIFAAHVYPQTNLLNEISLGLKSYAMGKTGGITCLEPNSVLLNPAVINLNRETSFALYYSNYAEDENTFNLGGYIPLKKIGDMAFVYQNFSAGNIPEVDSDFNYISAFSFISEQATLAYIKPLFNQFTLGISGRWSHSYFTLEGSSSDYNSYGMDAGISYRLDSGSEIFNGLSAGVVIYNLFAASDDTYLPGKKYRFIIEKIQQVNEIKITGIANLYYYQNNFSETEHRIQLGLNAAYTNFDVSIGYYSDFYAIGIGFSYGRFRAGYVYGVHHGAYMLHHNHGISIGASI